MNNYILDVNSYNIEDLLDIFNLDLPITHDKINNISREFDNKYSNIDNIQYRIFLESALEKVKNYYNIDNTILQNNNHDIIPKKRSVGENTYEISYKSSNLNQIEREVITRLVNVDSIFRKDTNNSTNDFIYEFKDELKNVISYKLVSLELPNIWYTFSNILKNNTFSIEVKNYSTGVLTPSNEIIYDTTNYDITIPEGNYNISELTDVINNLLINYGDGTKFILFEINPYTGKSIFRAKTSSDNDFSGDPNPFEGDASSNIYFSPDFEFEICFDLPEFRSIRQQQNEIIFEYSGDIDKLKCKPELLNIYNQKLRPIEYNCGYILGFVKSHYIVTKEDIYINLTKETTPITYNCYLESTGYYGNSINKYIFLKVEDYNNSRHNNFITDNINSINTDNILAKIQVYNGSFSMIYNNNSDFIKKERKFFGPVNLKKIKISLVDRFDRLIDIGESIFSLTLEINQIYS